MEQLPNDILEYIGQLLHKSYMRELAGEIYEEALDYEWRKEDFGNDSDYEMDTDSDTDSDYSFVSDESF